MIDDQASPEPKKHKSSFSKAASFGVDGSGKITHDSNDTACADFRNHVVSSVRLKETHGH
jgi:hypothetical protein